MSPQIANFWEFLVNSGFTKFLHFFAYLKAYYNVYYSNKNLHWSMSKQNYYSNRDFSPGYWISSWRPIRSNFNFCLPRFATKVLNLNITHWPKFKFRFFQFQSSQIITSSIYSLQIGKCTCNIFLVMYGLTTRLSVEWGFVPTKCARL